MVAVLVELFMANWLVYSWLAIKIGITTGAVLGWIPKISWKHLREEFSIWVCVPLMALLAVLPIFGIPLILLLRRART